MDYRKIFNDRVKSKDFDAFRFRYCDELFSDVISHSELDAAKTALEIGPGTGQATEPILKSGCSYLAIELGANFTKNMEEKFKHYENFHIVNADFETYPLTNNTFDLVYSAATIQWIPEEIAFPKIYNILKPKGTLAMFMTHTDYRTSNEKLYEKIQEVYSHYFKPQSPYTAKFNYYHAINYGFVDFEKREYQQTIEYTANQFVSSIRIHADHLTIPEPYKTNFLDGVRNAILSFGNKIVLHNTIILYLTRKP